MNNFIIFEKIQRNKNFRHLSRLGFNQKIPSCFLAPYIFHTTLLFEFKEAALYSAL